MTRVLKVTIFSVVFLTLFGASAYLTMRLLIKGEDTVVVPELSGHNAVQVLKILSGLGLNAKIKGSEYSSTIPENHVISQDPAPGTEIKSGRQVRVVMSKGADTIPMPRLTGLHMQQALLILEGNGFCQGNRSFVSHPSVEKDRVISQVPSPGMQTARSRCTDLLISTGPRMKWYKMPHLSDIPIENAVEMIENINLELGKMETAFQKEKPPNTVIGQDPLPGHPVAERSVVNLVVNRIPGSQNTNFMDADGFIRHRVQPGFLKRHVRVHLEGPHTTEDLFNEYIPPGEEILLLVPTVLKATLRVYEDRKVVLSRVFD